MKHNTRMSNYRLTLHFCQNLSDARSATTTAKTPMIMPAMAPGEIGWGLDPPGVDPGGPGSLEGAAPALEGI